MLSSTIKRTALAVLAIYSVVLLIFGISLPSLAGKIVSYIPLVLVVLFAIFDRWAWHQVGVIRISKRPYLEGTWRGQLTSYRLDDQSKEISSSHQVVLVVQQTFTTISLTLMTAESKSRSVAPDITKEANDDFIVHYQYQNTPQLAVRAQSQIHRGGAAIEIHGLTPGDLSAEYWTARKSQGTFDRTKVSPKRVGTFAEGQAIV